MAVDGGDEDVWLAAFHAGSPDAVERCYREYHRAVADAVSRLLSATDAETVSHEVFYALLSDVKLRENFQGGQFAAWLVRVARNRAIDYLRRWRRECPEALDEDFLEQRAAAERGQEELEARLLVEQFRRERLPPGWDSLFEARFIRQLTQREAAAELGLARATLLYREHRIRALLTKFLLGEEHR